MMSLTATGNRVKLHRCDLELLPSTSGATLASKVIQDAAVKEGVFFSGAQIALQLLVSCIVRILRRGFDCLVVDIEIEGTPEDMLESEWEGP
ncbi:hypothetical protein RHMOL_Rhmol02G0009500 [Rhododendron molle]|uniref:Uncharacterized protein n=1 Tax=Rhododendron molle TaxID=49168 RepID=A0ACC0PKR4_RHOML|nr:hypothetical protein RHMOL_Rhmol02G0009500 [Rhododendron molle]